MRFLKVKVFSILVDRVCKVKYDSLKVCSKMFRHFVGGFSYLRILNASTIRIQICSFPIWDFASSQQFHQLNNSPVFVCFRSMSLIFLAINSTVIAALQDGDHTSLAKRIHRTKTLLSGTRNLPN